MNTIIQAVNGSERHYTRIELLEATQRELEKHYNLVVRKRNTFYIDELGLIKATTTEESICNYKLKGLK